MTVIAWDGKTIACDSQMSDNGIIQKTIKLHRVNDSWIASSGSSRAGVAMRQWIADGTKDFPKLEKIDEGTRMVVFSPSGITEYEASEYGVLLIGDLLAWGSGCDLAIGAMEMGASAVEAVRVACKHEVHCGGDILSAEIGDSEYINWGSA